MTPMFGFRDHRRLPPPFAEPAGPVTPDADPALIRDAHLFVLDRVGREMGYAFLAQPCLEPPSDRRIAIFGRFDPRAREREFGLQLGREQLPDGRQGRVAWLMDFYIPENRRRQRFGARLMADLLGLWDQAGAVEVRLTSTAEAVPAYENWGFAADPERRGLDDGLHPMRLVLR